MPWRKRCDFFERPGYFALVLLHKISETYVLELHYGLNFFEGFYLFILERERENEQGKGQREKEKQTPL